MTASRTPAPPGRAFRFLYPGAGRPDAEVLSAHATLAEVQAGAFVVRDETAGCFWLFAAAGDFWAWERALPPERRTFHEVIFSQVPQRLKFDFDATVADFGRLPDAVFDRIAPGRLARAPAGVSRPQAAAEVALAYLLSLVCDVFDAAYGPHGLTLTPSDVYVASSLRGGEGGSGMAQDDKLSYHLIVAPYYAANHHEAKEFTSRVRAELEAEAAELLPFLDTQVNSATQNFRLPGSQKLGSGRPKVLCPALARRLGARLPDSPPAAVVTAPAAPGPPAPRACLPPLVAAEAPAAAPDEALTAADVRAVVARVEACLDAARLPGDPPGRPHSFQRRLGTMFLFRRERPSFCALCGRTHEAENSLLVAVRPAALPPGAPASAPPEEALVELWEHCRRNPGATRSLGCVACSAGAFPGAAAPASPAAAEKAAAGRLAALVAALNDGRRDPAAAADRLFESLPPDRKTVYNAPQMARYEPAETLAVWAQMGVGKTQALRRYLAEHYPAAGAGLAPAPVIRVVAFRVTFSRKQAGDFPGFVHYEDAASGQLTAARHPRLIVQVESLHRLAHDAAAGEPVDLLVLDEVESILSQFSSGLHKSFDLSFAVFQYLLATAARVVCMDANLSDRTFRTLQRMRPAHPVYLHRNLYSRAAGALVRVTAARPAWLAALAAAVGAGRRVVLASTSLAALKKALAFLRAQYPDKRYGVYTSETPPALKAEHFGDVDRYWADYDVLAYTPTVSAGVSYERPGYAETFMYLTSASCDVETARQMMGRVRSVRVFTVCFQAPRCTLPTDIETLERLACERRALFVDPHTLYGPQGRPPAFAFDATTGRLQKYQGAFFPLWLENCRIANLSKSDYVARFLDQVALTGARLEALEAPAGPVELANLEELFRDAGRALARGDAQRVAAAPDLSPPEVAAIRDRREAQGVTDEERAALSRHYLRQRYGWEGQITTRFVEELGAPKVQAWFANWRTMLAGRDPGDSLKRLLAREGVVFSALDASQDVAFQPVRPPVLAGPSVLGGAPALTGSRTAFDGIAASLESAALRQRTHYPRHFYANWLLSLCGFRSLLDPAPQPEAWVLGTLACAHAALSARLDALLAEFELRHPGYGQLGSPDLHTRGKTYLRLVNGILRQQYGVEVRRSGGGFRLVRLAAAQVFDIEESRTPAAEDVPPPVTGGLPAAGSALARRRPCVPNRNAPLDLRYDEELFFLLWWGTRQDAPP